MAHKIMRRDIQTGVEMGWHGETNVVDKITRENCGIVYAMEKVALTFPDGTSTDREIYDENDEDKRDSRVFGIRSLDDGMMIGNAVGAGYPLFDNERIIDAILSALAGTSHVIVSVGTVCNRSKAFCSIKLSDDFTVANRQHQAILNVCWGHGGVMKLTAKDGIVTIVCQNTLTAALHEKSEFVLDLKHTGNAELKIANLSKMIDRHFGVTAEFNAALQSLHETSETERSARQFTAGFLVRDPLPEITDVSTRTTNTIDRIVQLFRGGAGNKGETRADLLNGITDYFTHESSGGEDTWKQFESSEFGQADKRKTEAFRALLGKPVIGLGDYAEIMQRGDRVLQFA